MWILWNKIYFIETVFKKFMKWGLKGEISIDVDSGPPSYVLWCCGGFCHQPDSFFQIVSGHIVNSRVYNTRDTNHVSGKMDPHSKKFSLTSVLNNGFTKQILCNQLLIRSNEMELLLIISTQSACKVILFSNLLSQIYVNFKQWNW